MTEPAGTVRQADLSAYLDGELAPDRRALVDRHLADCPADADLVAALRRQDGLLRIAIHELAGEHAPAGLVARAHAAARRRRWRLGIGAVAATVLLVVAGLWGSRPIVDDTADGLAALVQDGIAAHRSYGGDPARRSEPPGPADAAAAEMARRFRASVASPDLSAFGYRLEASRLLTTSRGPAIQFLYRDGSGNNVTCLFAAYPGLLEVDMQAREADGLEALVRVEDGLGYVVVGEAPRGLLQRIAQAVYSDLEANGPGR